MKYPQLVSTRAVNAISDWLVSRLEQLGVEAPLIYSRLLLSLLQSSVQINDPIEFSNLETFLANRKGNSKRYPTCDTDTLRKITAVQCLMEIVSSEQEITKIENLVDELCEKVTDIEKQTTNLEEDDDLQIAALALGSVLKTSTATPSSSFNTANEGALSTAGKGGGRSLAPDSSENTAKSLSVSRKTKEQQIASDVEDPRKRYYRAFPALSKEMEDSIGLLRRNTKLLAWPVDRKICSSSSNKVATTAVVANVNTSSVALANEKTNITSTEGGGSSTTLLGNSQGEDSNTVLRNTAGVKRKTKRRRNQAMSKGKTSAGNNIRKNSYCGGSPTWDTDFEGSWEMGRDLIKEFIVKQNSRNRSTSESAAYNMASGGGCGNGSSGIAHEMHEKRMKHTMNEGPVKHEPMATEQDLQQLQANDNVAAAETCVVDISLCDDVVENSKSDETLASVSEITEGSLSTARRLYERDISNDSINEQSIHDQHHYNHHHQQQSSSTASSTEQLDFAQFKAKFNSSVEALWKNANSSGGSVAGDSNINQSMLQSSIVSDSSVPYRSEDLKSFWTNYYSHHYDVDKFKQLNYNDLSDSSMTAGTATTTHSDRHSDYFSMPTISRSDGAAASGGVDDFDKSVGGKRAGGKSSPIGVFLQNTIWSENSNAGYPDTDESFFMKVLNSTSTATIQKSQDQFKMDVSGSDKSFYYPYQTSKWSEGVNGVPQNSFYQQQQQQPLIITSSSSSSSISTMDHSARSCYTNEFADSTPSSSSSYLGGNPNWHLPAGNNLQADVKSWSSSNPTSLTELYGGGGGSAGTTSLGKKNTCTLDRNDAASITLANHSTTSSGFIAYSRIKSYVKLVDTKPIAKWQTPEVDYHHLSLSTTPDDENLLTSERTHFHPIKMSYADGHTFEISSDLDPVDFERSDSGYLYLESERYLEYTRSDTLSEEDSSSVVGHSSFHSMSRDSASSVASSTKSGQSEFVIRFRLRTTDKSCQTESKLITPSVLRSSLAYQLASAHLPRTAVVQAAHNCANGDDDEDDWMDIGCIGGKGDEECVSMDQWSMAEIGKKCVDNNNSSHTLWGMCPACNNDMKSIPANRMLKAELKMEGDEIMSDLRYMQDLYIGSDWEDQNDAYRGGANDDDEDDDDTDLDAETIRDCEFYQETTTPAASGELEEDQDQKDIMYNVNKLIADLLRPENAQTLANALGAVGCVGGIGGGGGFGVGGDAAGGGGCMKQFGAENEGKDEKYVGGLWNSDENIIWKKEFNPIDIFSRLNNNNNDSFLEKLDWEYSNLAEIWGKTSPDNKSGQSTAKEDCSSSVKVDAGEDIHEATTVEDEENIKIACKNMKNLLKSTTITPPAIFEMNERRLNDSKRMQCFISSNKFKISNRFDRKRRHSASQNVCSNNNNNIAYNNNNSIYDNNNLKLSLLGSAPDTPLTTAAFTTITTTQTEETTKDTLSDYDRNTLPYTDEDEYTQQHLNDDKQDNDSQATIITCKYWTTMHPIINGNIVVGDQENADDEQSASFFIDKNSQFIDGLSSITLNTSSILKHVTLVSRPLTR